MAQIHPDSIEEYIKIYGLLDCWDSTLELSRCFSSWHRVRLIILLGPLQVVVILLSKRGGGGYIRIIKSVSDKHHMINDLTSRTCLRISSASSI